MTFVLIKKPLYFHYTLYLFIVLDSIQTIFIWAISINLPNWQKAQPFQPVGYLILIVGTFIYYDIIFMPSIRWLIRKYTASGNDVYNIQGEVC